MEALPSSRYLSFRWVQLTTTAGDAELWFFIYCHAVHCRKVSSLKARHNTRTESGCDTANKLVEYFHDSFVNIIFRNPKNVNNGMDCHFLQPAPFPLALLKIPKHRWQQWTIENENWNCKESIVWKFIFIIDELFWVSQIRFEIARAYRKISAQTFHVFRMHTRSFD